MNGRGEAARTVRGQCEVPDDELCRWRCQGGTGNVAPNFQTFAAVKPPIVIFLPHDGGTAHNQNVPCRPHATGTSQHQNKQGTYANTIQLRKRPLKRTGTNAQQADHEAANTTAHKQNHCSGHDVTINRPLAGRPTPNWPGMYGSKHERRSTGRRHQDAPRPPTTIPTNTTEHHNSTITNPTNQR